MRSAIYQLVGLAGMFALGMLCGRRLRSAAGRAALVHPPRAPGMGIGLDTRWRRHGPEAKGPSAGPAEATSDIDSWDTYPASDEIEDAG